VYLVDPERHATSKTELNDILSDANIKKPVLVLTPKPEEGEEQLPELELPPMTKVYNSRIVRKPRLTDYY